VNNQRHSAVDAATGWDSRCAAAVRIGSGPRGWRSDTGGTGRYLKVGKANFQPKHCHGGTQYDIMLNNTSRREQVIVQYTVTTL
jgi:hypothetical protein